MLVLDNVTKKFGDFVAVENVSLNMDNGLYALLAPNGAGKTTIIKMIVTLLAPTSGEILYDGADIYDMGAEYRGLIGYLPQHFGYYKNNTPVQFLTYIAALKGMEKEGAAKTIDELLEMVGLKDDSHKKMKKFSGGMLQRVGIAQAMLNDPGILILDEPTAGLDPKERVRFRNIISALSRDRTVILSTHIVSDIESIANQVIMIKDRHIFVTDTVPDICSRLDNRVFEKLIPDDECESFEKEYLMLSARQEKNNMLVRFLREDDQPVPEGAKAVLPGLEDVFLTEYR